MVHGRQGDPSSVGHRMEGDVFGRPGMPLCGRSSEGLFYRRDVSWQRVPADQRCARCERAPGRTVGPETCGIHAPVGTVHVSPQ